MNHTIQTLAEARYMSAVYQCGKLVCRYYEEGCVAELVN